MFIEAFAMAILVFYSFAYARGARAALARLSGRIEYLEGEVLRLRFQIEAHESRLHGDEAEFSRLVDALKDEDPFDARQTLPPGYRLPS